MSQDAIEQHHSSFQSIDPRDIPYANIGTIESILSNPLTSEATKLLCTYRLTFIKHYEQQQNSIIQQATNHRKQAEIDWIWSKLLEE